MSTINVAIPEIMRYFQTDLDSVQWTITGFILATGIIAPITGSLGDRYKGIRFVEANLYECNFQYFNNLLERT
jgi:MFS family permease